MRSLSAFIELFKSPFSQQLRVVCSKTSWEWWRWILVYRDSTGRQFHYLFNQVLVNAPLIEDGNQVGSSTNTVEGGNVETNYVVINIYKQLASHTQITTECNSIHSLVVKYLPSKQMSWVRFPVNATDASLCLLVKIAPKIIFPTYEHQKLQLQSRSRGLWHLQQCSMGGGCIVHWFHWWMSDTPVFLLIFFSRHFSHPRENQNIVYRYELSPQSIVPTHSTINCKRLNSQATACAQHIPFSLVPKIKVTSPMFFDEGLVWIMVNLMSKKIAFLFIGSRLKLKDGNCCA